MKLNDLQLHSYGPLVKKKKKIKKMNAAHPKIQMSNWQRSLMPMYTSMGQQRMGWYGWNNEYEEVTTAGITTRITLGQLC